MPNRVLCETGFTYHIAHVILLSYLILGWYVKPRSQNVVHPYRTTEIGISGVIHEIWSLVEPVRWSLNVWLGHCGHLENFLCATKTLGFTYSQNKRALFYSCMVQQSNRLLRDFFAFKYYVIWYIQCLYWKFLNFTSFLHRNAMKYAESKTIFWSENSFAHFNSESWDCIWVLFRFFLYSIY